jgi:hypothetical protein
MSNGAKGEAARGPIGAIVIGAPPPDRTMLLKLLTAELLSRLAAVPAARPVPIVPSEPAVPSTRVARPPTKPPACSRAVIGLFSASAPTMRSALCAGEPLATSLRAANSSGDQLERLSLRTCHGLPRRRKELPALKFYRPPLIEYQDRSFFGAASLPLQLLRKSVGIIVR